MIKELLIIMDNGDNLKNYLMGQFDNHKYKKISLVELYASDQKYYAKLEESGLIYESAKSFFKKKGREIINAGYISTEAFRILKYESIIDEYQYEVEFKKQKKDSDTFPKVQQLEEKQREEDSHEDVEKPPELTGVLSDPVLEEKTIHCINDMSVLNRIQVSKVTIKRTGKKVLFPKYICPVCEKRFTTLTGYADGSIIILNNFKYINIIEENDADRFQEYSARPQPIAPGSRCYVYIDQKPRLCQKCVHSELIIKKIQYKTKKKKLMYYEAKYCKECDTYYLKYHEYKTHKKDWVVLNPNELSVFEEKMLVRKLEKAELKKRRLENKKDIKEVISASQDSEQILRDQLEAKRHADEKWNLIKSGQFGLKKAPVIQQTEERVHDNHIRIRDFVVRRSLFKCKYNDHELKNIDGLIGVIDGNGNIKQMRVPAGYCPRCNVFFIMESIFAYLKMEGTLICRISDEDTYLSNSTYVNDLHLAKESILMQYGYTVSQQKGLKDAQRTKLLSLLVDNEIMTRDEIIGYLNFFINQRKNDNKFRIAIDKWKSDREFISEYRIGNYDQYVIRSLKRKGRS